MKNIENNSLTVNYEGKPAYCIQIARDYKGLTDALSRLGMKNRRFMVISDSNVSKYYLDECTEQIKSISSFVTSYIFEAGETSKNLETVNKCYTALIESSFDRNDVLIALGGGVVGDLTGFVAATYLRGIRFIQLPTSLLAMVDSSIGGKTGVDYESYKNMVGAFYQPKLVYMNISALLTLGDREYYSGMGEIIKHGLIKDSGYYYWLKEHHSEIKDKQYDILKEMILHSCIIKKTVVEADPKEKGDRALLNFGHTIGHSIEKLMNFTLLHGECVSIGMVAAAYISLQRGFLSHTEIEDILETMKIFYQPVNVSGLDADEVYSITKLDKKMDSDKIKFILLQKTGSSFIDSTVSREEILAAINFVLK